MLGALVLSALAAAAPLPSRLPAPARPLAYALSLHIIPGPGEPTFRGSVDIELAVREPTQSIWLHGSGLTVRAASFRTAGATLPAHVNRYADELVFWAPEPLAPGAAALHVEYEGDAAPFTREVDGRWYALTQTQPTGARRLFPCFDEPGYKTPWRVEIEAPRGLVVLGNAPAIGRRAGADGMEVTTFAATPPLPSHLVAFAVGPFELIDGGRAGRVPIRVAVPAGRRAGAPAVAAAARAAIDKLERWLGAPFPFPKLDLVVGALPESEAPGLVTVSRDLSEPWVVTRDLAHAWFGGSLTPAWWDDVWLSEAFATWLAEEVDRPNPAMNRLFAMSQDGRAPRALAAALVDDGRIAPAIDRVAYQKGEAVIATFARFVGAPVFQRAVRAYVAAHAFGSVTRDDFFAALASASGRDLGAAWRTWLEQPGYPVVRAALRCQPGQPAVLELSQRPSEAPAEDQPPRLWHIPLCARWGDPTRRACTLLTAARGALPLGAACPAWASANEGQVGYYRVAYDDELARRLIRAPLEAEEAFGALRDLQELLRAGALPYGEALPFLASLADDARPELAYLAVSLVRELDRDIVGDGLRPAYQRFVRATFGRRAARLGWEPAPGESADARHLRPALVGLVAIQGADPDLRDRAVALMRRWLADPTAYDPTVIDTLVVAAAAAGDRALFAEMLAAARASRSSFDRPRLLAGLAAFDDPELAGELLEALPALTPDEAAAVLARLAAAPHARAAVWSAARRRYHALASAVAQPEASIPAALGTLCEAADESDVRAVLEGRAPLPAVAEAVSHVADCRALVRAHRESVGRFLGRYR